jgi:hypothetical protein
MNLEGHRLVDGSLVDTALAHLSSNTIGAVSSLRLVFRNKLQGLEPLSAAKSVIMWLVCDEVSLYWRLWSFPRPAPIDMYDPARDTANNTTDPVTAALSLTLRWLKRPLQVDGFAPLPTSYLPPRDYTCLIA